MRSIIDRKKRIYWCWERIYSYSIFNLDNSKSSSGSNFILNNIKSYYYHFDLFRSRHYFSSSSTLSIDKIIYLSFCKDDILILCDHSNWLLFSMNYYDIFISRDKKKENVIWILLRDKLIKEIDKEISLIVVYIMHIMRNDNKSSR